jgi:hypothetical protein
MTAVEITIAIGLLVLIPAGLYGLHRFALYLEAKDLLYYWHKKPRSGSMSSALGPLQELIQPQIRHVVTVKDERQVADEAGDGDDPAEPR